MLSQARAHAVVDSPYAQRATTGRLQAIGNGASNPIAPTDTPVHMALNRRVEFHVVGYGQAIPGGDATNTSAASGPA